jgi:hypothetical protein
MTRSLLFLLGLIGIVGCQGDHGGATVVRGTIAHHSANDIVIGEEGCALTEGGAAYCAFQKFHPSKFPLTGWSVRYSNLRILTREGELCG